MEKKKIICITCPLGCEITVCGDDKTVHSMEGQLCIRGEAYAADEFLSPMRILTTSIRITGSESPLVPVRSRSPLPKDMLFRCMEQLRCLELKAPVELYDVVIPNILDTGVDIVTTSAVYPRYC